MGDGTYIALTYDYSFGGFHDIKQFQNQQEALNFANTATKFAVVIAPGTVQDWADGIFEQPVAFYWRGEPYYPG